MSIFEASFLRKYLFWFQGEDLDCCRPKWDWYLFYQNTSSVWARKLQFQ